MCLESETKRKDLDSILEVFADRRRRLIIECLRQSADGVASYDDLVDFVLRHGDGQQESEHIRSQLHHVTLPKLEEADIIEYDRRSATVRYDPCSVVDDLAEFIEDIED